MLNSQVEGVTFTQSRSVGAYVTGLLKAYGVRTVFGIPGVHNLELYRGLRESGLRHVTPRNEQGAGFMADGYARATGRPGVCFTITGPGLTNIATAMGQAYADSIPLLVISTVNAHGRMGSGQGWLHELPNQQALAAQLAAFSHTVHHVDEIAPVLARAFALFDSGRPRPVHIELPIDVLNSDAPAPLLRSVARLAPPVGAGHLVRQAAELLNGAERPLILAGGGAQRAAAALSDLAERLDAPLLMTINGRGILKPENPLGVSLTATHAAARSLVAESDVVLAIGTELGPTDYDMFEDGQFRLPGVLIRVDVDPSQVVNSHAPHLGIVGDAAATAEALSALVQPRSRNGKARAAAVHAQGSAALSASIRGDLKLLGIIGETLDDVLIVGDSTQLVYSGNMAYAAGTPGSYFNSATGYGTLGYAVPAAIGAKTGNPEKAVVALVGDGGVLFTLGEMVSAVDCGAPVIVLLHENGGYGEIKSYMEAQEMEPVGVDLFNPDFVQIGKACGWHAERIVSVGGLRVALGEAAMRQVPSLLVFGEDLRAAAAEL